IGVVGLEDIIPYVHGKRLLEGLPAAQVQSATDLMYGVLIPSTEDEIAMALEAHNIADQVHQRVASVMAPGKTEREVMAEGSYLMSLLGSLDGLAWISTADAGSNRPPRDRRIEPDDIVRVYVELAGPAGYWTELGAVYSFREPPELMRRKFNIIVKAMNAAADMMRPGVKAGDLSAVIEQTYRDDGWRIVGRSIWDAHGQGLMGHLPPRAWPGSQEELKANMVLNMHPGVQTEDGLGFSLTNNYVVTPNGGRPLGGFQHKWNLLPG
ncbi:MAG: M24 family metallopeptidase, partial [Chloroflexi bacterium]|nr:M24 family metallopeptidase [Chloroflexota bacterium]